MKKKEYTDKISKNISQKNKDWEELEKWEKKNEQEEIKKYGTNISKINKKNASKEVNNYVKGINVVLKTMKISATSLFIIVAIIILIFGIAWYYSIKSRVNIDAKKTIESMYGVKLKLISKEIDNNGNGKYKFELKNEPKIQFVAIKKWGNLEEDLSDRIQKYYFEKWDSANKNDFRVYENTENDILNYEIYIENFKNINTAINEIYEFVDFCSNNYTQYFKIYIKVSEEKLYPNLSIGADREEVIQKAIDDYYKYYVN